MERPIAILALSLVVAACDGRERTAPPPAAAPSPAAAADPRIAAADAAAAATRPSAPALSLAVLRRGEATPWARAYGDAIVGGAGATPTTIFRVGSLTKQFTAAAIMRLVEQGSLGLDEPFTRYLEGYPAPRLAAPAAGGRAPIVTLRHLLTHTGGIPDFVDPAFLEGAGRPTTLEALIARFADRPLDFAPGARWSYSNSGYVLLGAIVERVSGRRWEDHLAAEVLPRAGLTATTICPDQPIASHAHGYRRVDGRFEPAAPISMTAARAAGALCSTPSDLVRWARALARGEVVSPASYALMTTPAALADGTRFPYGMGLGLGELEGHRVVSHGGGINGFASALAYYPDDDVAIAALVSAEEADAQAVVDRLARAALGLPPPAAAAAPPASAR